MNTPMKNKKGFSFNFIDAILIVVILVSVSFLIYVMFFSDSAIITSQEDSAHSASIDITFRIEGVDNYLAVDIEKDENLADADREFIIGKVWDVKKTGATKVMSDETTETTVIVSDPLTGEETEKTETVTVYYSHPDKSDWEITVTADAIAENGSYKIMGNNVRIGDEITIRTPYFSAKAVCVAITETNDSSNDNGGNG